MFSGGQSIGEGVWGWRERVVWEVDVGRMGNPDRSVHSNRDGRRSGGTGDSSSARVDAFGAVELERVKRASEREALSGNERDSGSSEGRSIGGLDLGLG